MLRSFSVGVVAAVAATIPLIVVVPAAAAPADEAVSVPAAAWTPGQVNRAVVGGAPPAGRAQKSRPAPVSESGAQSWACTSSSWGVLPDYSMERFKISDRLQAGVNLANGNLWIDHRDLTVRGTGLNMNLRHSYGYYGEWHLNAGRDMGLELRTNEVLMPVDGGACATFPRNADGTYGVARNGVRASMTKNVGGSYTARFFDSGETWSYNADGWLLNRADRNGNTITYFYNSDGSLASMADTQGRVTTFVTTNGHITKITDPSGAVAGEYTYDANSRLTRLTDRDGKAVSFTYNADGQIATITDQIDRSWSVEFSNYGDVTKLTVPRQAGAVSASFAYDTPVADKTTYTDPNGNKTIYTFEEIEGRQISAQDALGHTQSQTWTANSDLQTTTDGLNNSTTGSYDTLNNLISTKLPTGATSTIGYTNTALPNLPTSVKDPAGNEITREYDRAGNVTKVRSVQLDANLDYRSYSSPKNLLDFRLDANGKRTTFGYDQAGNLTTVTPPEPLGVTRIGYDSLSRITSVTNGNNKRVDYAYDKLDRVVAISSSGTTLQSMTYNELGNLVTRSTPGVTTRFTYDTYPSSSLITSAKRTQGGATETVSYNYDQAGNLTSLTDPAGTHTYAFDAAYRLTSLKDAFGQTTTFGYDNADRRISSTFPGAGSQTNVYDKAGRLTSLTAKNTGGTELLKATYNYTLGNGVDSDQLQSKTIAGTTTAYTYDALKHLKTAGSTSFTVDNADNITNLAGTAHTVNAANQLTAADGDNLGYDKAGNLTSASVSSMAHEYSATNQLLRSTSSGTETFKADYDTTDQTQPRTITENLNGNTTTRVFTNTAVGLTTVAENGVRTSVARDPRGTLITEKVGEARFNFITDNQGSVLATLDTTGKVTATFTYNPYGVVTVTGASAIHRFRYLGGYTLRNGQNHFGYRYYNPTWGRFTAPDPTGQERNSYAYSQADPINNSDPTGGSTGSTWGAAVGGLVGGIVVGGLAASCPLTAGAGCVGAGIVMGGLGGAAGAGLGSSIGGGTREEVRDDGLSGGALGAFGAGGKFVKGLKDLL
ncbi:hypothetical protein BS329_23830 [Amycolatopsis coloradensis]|uniref:Teneurin-like YD-shell domain-containing protein n=1 Tax=Amycolatopsis coloradensis TaxID=76021 RepID=A0A1R0KNX3_9PSEU|nr:hypothetical protein BS329_23830 [Amycolatopsis coloradensis]